MLSKLTFSWQSDQEEMENMLNMWKGSAPSARARVPGGAHRDSGVVGRAGHLLCPDAQRGATLPTLGNSLCSAVHRAG